MILEQKKEISFQYCTLQPQLFIKDLSFVNPPC